jgi:DNA-directed RNA polymerase beta subunit
MFKHIKMINKILIVLIATFVISIVPATTANADVLGTEKCYDKKTVIDKNGKKKTEKTLFSKRANIGILPLMTPSASYIINGVERVIISQIIRSYGIFFAKKEFRYSFKVIPENGPWLEVQTEKSGVVVARINKSRKFPITTLLRIF